MSQNKYINTARLSLRDDRGSQAYNYDSAYFICIPFIFHNILWISIRFTSIQNMLYTHACFSARRQGKVFHNKPF